MLLVVLILLAVAALSDAQADHSPNPSAAVVSCGRHLDTLYGHTLRHARERDLPPYLLAAVAWRESGWHTLAVNDSGRHRAEGLMQIVAVPYHLSMTGWTFDACASIDYAGRYLQRLMVRYHDSVRLALGEYSGGAVGYYDDVVGYMERQAQTRVRG